MLLTQIPSITANHHSRASKMENLGSKQARLHLGQSKGSKAESVWHHRTETGLEKELRDVFRKARRPADHLIRSRARQHEGEALAGREMAL